MGFSIGSMVALKELVLFQRELLKKKLEARRKAREKAERLQRQRELAAKTAAAKEAARLARIALEKKQREDEKRRQEELAAEKEFINKIKGYRKKLGLKDEDALPPAEINFWKAVVDYENNQLKPTEHTKENYYKALFKYKSKPPATGTIKTTFTEADIKKIWDDYNATIKTYTYVKIYTDGVFKQFRMLREEQSIIELRTSKYGKEWSEWKTIAGNKDDISLLDLPSSIAWERAQVLTGGASFGKTIACTEKQLIVGEPDNSKAEIWKRSGTNWSRTKTLTGGTGFGASVSNSSKYIAIGEPQATKTEVYKSTGSVYKTLTGGVSFGKMVACNNEYIAVAEPISNKVILNDFSGITGWFKIPQTKYDGLPDNANGYAGYHIKGGKYQLVRPVGTTDTYTKYRGRAWVKNGSWGGVLWYLGGKIGFAAQNEDWKKIGQSISSSLSEYKTGVQLSADGSIVSLGSHSTNYVEIYKYNNGNNAWGILGNRITGSGGFGISVSLSVDGGIVSIGTETGNYVEIYKYNNGNNTWEILGNRITGSGKFGWAVSLSADGGIVSIGAHDANYVEIYKYNNGNNTWEIPGNRITGSGYFGLSVSLSADGGIVSIGASGGNYVEIYKYNNGNNTWRILGNRITGSGNFGTAVSLSADGGIVSISTGSGNYIEIYKYNNGNNTWGILGNRITGYGQFGWNMQSSKDGSTVAASSDNNQYEEAYRYDKSSNSWKLRGKRKSLGKYNGSSQIALNEGGNVWAIAGTQANKVEVFSFLGKKTYIDTNDGKHYYDNKEVTDATKFDSIMETVAPLSAIPVPLPQANRNLKITNTVIQEQPNKTGNYVSLLGTGTATTPIASFENMTKTEYPKPNDSISMNEKELLITSKADKKAYVYDITTDPLTTTPAKTIDIPETYGDSCTLGSDYITVGSKALSQVNVYSFAGTLTNEIEGHRDYGFSLSSNIGHLLTGSETANYADIHRLKISEEENKLLAKRLLSLEQEEKDRVAKEAARRIAEVARIAAIKDEEKRKAAQAKEDARKKAEQGRLDEANRIKTAYDDAIREVTGSSTRRQTFNTNSLWAISEILRKKGIQFNLSTLVST